MRVLVVEPERRPELREIDESLESMQEVVGGPLQTSYPFEDTVVLVRNREGSSMELPANRGLRDTDGQICDIVSGTFCLCGIPFNDHFSSLTRSRSNDTKNGSTRPKCSGGWMDVSSVSQWRQIGR